MMKRKFHDYLHAFSAAPFTILLILTLLMLILPPFLDDWVSTRILVDVFLTAILAAIIYAVRSNRSQVIAAVVLALPLIIATWSNHFIAITTIGLTTRIFGALFFGFAAVNILLLISKTEEIKRETIFAAIEAYLLIALMWAFLYMILEALAPGSFSLPEGDFRAETRRYEYFSFITITTLGYGDITPLTDKASALTMLEALIGQIYLVVLVAWLVGMHVSRRSK